MIIDSLENNPDQGTAIGNSCYKIRDFDIITIDASATFKIGLMF